MNVPSPSGVLLRAVYFQESLRKLEALAPSLLELARRELPAEAFAPVHALTWLPVEWSNQLDGIVLREVGAEAVLELYRSTTSTSADVPAYAPLWSAARKLLGAGPGDILHWFPAAWSLTTRNFGIPSYARTATGGRIAVAHLPPFIRGFEGFRPCICGSLLGLIDMLGFDGEVTARDEGDSVVFDMHWWPLARRR